MDGGRHRLTSNHVTAWTVLASRLVTPPMSRKPSANDVLTGGLRAC
jgi:hypothetical protein